MKIAGHFFMVILATFLSGTCTFAQQEMNANLILLDSKISAANGHYKTVLILIADKKMTARITKNETELEQIDHDIAILIQDKNATEEEIRTLVEKFNGTLSPQPVARRPSREEAWNGLLAAMQEGRSSEARDFVTERGFASLQERAGAEKEAAFRRWGAIWAKWPLRWRTIGDDHATAVMGLEVKEHTLEFVRTGQGWRLDEWKPGE